MPPFLARWASLSAKPFGFSLGLLVLAGCHDAARPPADEERKELLSLLDKQRQRLGEGWLNPNEIATGASELPKNLPPGVTPAQLAAYTVVSRVLLNLDEAITKE